MHVCPSAMDRKNSDRCDQPLLWQRYLVKSQRRYIENEHLEVESPLFLHCAKQDTGISFDTNIVDIWV